MSWYDRFPNVREVLGECVILFRGLGILGAHALTTGILGDLSNNRVRGVHCWDVYLCPYRRNWQIANGLRVMSVEALR
jgi:hypothetical protein